MANNRARQAALNCTDQSQDKFEAGKLSRIRSEYYSPFLEHSILACATRMSTSSDMRAFGSHYADQASTVIAQELRNPNIATLQAFLLLSDYEATCGRDRLGYMYCGKPIIAVVHAHI